MHVHSNSLEVIVIWYDGVSQFDDCAASLFEGLLQQDWLQGRVQLLPNVLQKTGLPKPHSVLKATQEVLVREFHYIQSVVLFL